MNSTINVCPYFIPKSEFHTINIIMIMIKFVEKSSSISFGFIDNWLDQLNELEIKWET